MAILDIQRATTVRTANDLPSDEAFGRWVDALPQISEEHEITIRLVDAEEIQSLNAQFREKNSPTNVLSFPFDVPAGVPLALLGDIVICPTVVEAEAQQQSKPLSHHWAHMVIHGCLHLLGYDHIDEHDAEKMEGIEIETLSALNIANPYIIHE